MADRVSASAIVLAGGRASRYGGNKMAADFEGQPLLDHAVRAVSRVCTEVIVAGPPDGLGVALPADLPVAPIVIPDTEPYAGPLVVLARAAASAGEMRLLLVGGDMPELQEAVLRRLLAWPQGCVGACLVVDGRPRPLPLGLERTVSVARATELIGAGERSLRSLVAALDLQHIPEAGWRALDPDARTLRDVDRPGDLRRD